MKLIGIGFGSMLAAQRVLAIMDPVSAPIKRVVAEAKERGMLITLVFAYADRGEVEDIETLPPAVDIAFSIIRAQLDRDKEKYIQRCLKNSENAKKGVEYRKQLSAIANLLLPNTAK